MLVREPENKGRIRWLLDWIGAGATYLNELKFGDIPYHSYVSDSMSLEMSPWNILNLHHILTPKFVGI